MNAVRNAMLRAPIARKMRLAKRYMFQRKLASKVPDAIDFETMRDSVLPGSLAKSGPRRDHREHVVMAFKGLGPGEEIPLLLDGD